jgi:hypothetical protein
LNIKFGLKGLTNEAVAKILREARIDEKRLIAQLMATTNEEVQSEKPFIDGFVAMVENEDVEIEKVAQYMADHVPEIGQKIQECQAMMKNTQQNMSNLLALMQGGLPGTSPAHTAIGSAKPPDKPGGGGVGII